MNFALFGFLDIQWPETNRIVWAVAFFVGTFLISLIITAIILVRIPATYFLDHHPREDGRESNSLRWWTFRIFKNLLGVIVVGAGIVMLVTPGQGVLTILIGVMLLDFPGKRRLERKLIGRPSVLRSINRFRNRFGKPPLVIDSDAA